MWFSDVTIFFFHGLIKEVGFFFQSIHLIVLKAAKNIDDDGKVIEKPSQM